MASNKDFVTMKTDVADFIGDASTTFLTKIGKWLNYRYRDLLSRYQWTQMYNTYTITTVANQASYALPNDYADIVYVYDNTNKISLTFKPEIGDQNNTQLVGSPYYFTISEISIGTQPSSSSAITFVSTSSSDNTQTIFIKGISGGYLKSETLTLGGTTPVNTTNSYTSIQQISKSATTVGGVTAKDASNNQLTYLEPAQLHTRDRILKLFYIPTGGISIVVRYRRATYPLVNDYDYPIIDCSDVIVLGAQADAWRAKRQFAKAAAMESQYEQMLNMLMFQEEQNKDISINTIPYPRNTTANASTTYNITG